MKISEVTRRNVIDELKISGIAWNGRLDEVSFLKRIFPLQGMHSTDGRFTNMADDVYQHRIEFVDWEQNWVFEDPRIGLLHCDDDIFLKFLCETIHPVVRTNAYEIKKLLRIYNEYLESDGYEICEIKKISGRPIFDARPITSRIVLDNLTEFDDEFVKEQLGKCDKRIKDGDYNGAISGARSLVEGVLGEIYLRCTGKRLEKSGDLHNDYKKVKDLIDLSEERTSNENLKAIIRSLNGIIQNLDTLSNIMGDRHRPVTTPEPFHAKFVVDCAKALSDFLFSTMRYKESTMKTLLDKLINILNSNKRFLPRKSLLQDPEISSVIQKMDFYLCKEVIEEFFKSFEVDSYRQNDIYFAFLRIFLDDLDVDDIVEVIWQANTNDQLIGFDEFEKELSEQKPEIVGEAYEKLYGGSR